jgi:hypothetical protein
MKYKSIIIVLLLLNVKFIFSQNGNLLVFSNKVQSEELKKYKQIGIISLDKSALITLNLFEKEYYIFKFDSDLSLIQKEKIHLGNLQSDIKYHKSLKIGKNNFLLFSVIEDTKEIFYAFKLNEGNIQINENPIEIYNGGRLGFVQFQNKTEEDQSNFFFTRSSNNKSNFLFLTRKENTLDNDRIKRFDVKFEFILNVFDENLDLKWSKEIELPYTLKDLNLLNVSLQENGDVAFVLNHGSNINERYYSTTKYEIEIPKTELLIFSPKNSKTISIFKEDLFCLNAITTSLNDEIIISGVAYTNQKIIEKYFIFVYDTKSQSNKLSFQEIPETFLSKIKNDNYRIELNKILNCSDNSFVLLFELRKEKQLISGKKGSNHNSYFFRDDLNLIKISNNKTLIFSKIIEKQQQDFELDYLSVFSILKEDKIILLYNNRFISADETKVAQENLDNCLNEVSINSTGDIEKHCHSNFEKINSNGIRFDKIVISSKRDNILEYKGNKYLFISFQ